ncbi:MAG: hypothetical protein P0Y56_04810 [Candidatus Andeanibacterium colombiense]|uniref:Uncharacterized protein n=1 Tax=Candidatus Andeanibacterium colombiense TaxID=3121345 RepID=A0AAJ6BQE0_9SPHN|nr:MAG: hypothetical protein P0Y56_04810 [Sphingomonadaceae bacterium]
MLHEPDSLRFASEATIAGLWGGACFAAAALTMWADHRRTKRNDVDRAGWVPWTKLFFAFLLVGMVLMLMAVKGWAAP